MTTDVNGNRSRRDEDVVVLLDEGGDLESQSLPLCLIWKVLTTKPFNAYGILEAMKLVMNPSKGYAAKGIGPNLFSFQFNSVEDLREVINREPWLFG